tara:strand:+ start:501 stop:809 length:309 start_codon:yes stop_codon:yes gene_type:complete
MQVRFLHRTPFRVCASHLTHSLIDILIPKPNILYHGLFHGTVVTVGGELQVAGRPCVDGFQFQPVVFAKAPAQGVYFHLVNFEGTDDQQKGTRRLQRDAAVL